MAAAVVADIAVTSSACLSVQDILKV